MYIIFEIYDCNWEECGREYTVFIYLRYSSHRLEGLKETAEYVIDDSRADETRF